MREVLVFGSGDCGQLGLGEDVWSKLKPCKHPFFSDKNIIQIAAGGLHSLALSEDGKVFSWGCNDEGALGHDAPEFSVGLVEGLPQVEQIVCGDSISAALGADGSVWTWGTFRDSKGLLGHSQSTEAEDIQRHPCRLEALQKEKIVQIAAGSNYLMALTAEGMVYAWGAGEQGQLGRRILERHKRATSLRPCNVTPRIGRSTIKISTIACGAYHTLALSEGHVYASGLNNHGQLGLGDKDSRINAELIDDSLWQGHSVKKMSAGEHHSLVLTESGQVFVFGRNDSFQCAMSKELENIANPTPLHSLKSIKAITSGSNHNLVVDVNNVVYSWGFGEMGQLGHGVEEDCPVPKPIESLQSGNVLQVSAGGQHSIILIEH